MKGITIIKVKSHDEEWPDSLRHRVNEAVMPELDTLDTVDHEYLITITIEELPA